MPVVDASVVVDWVTPDSDPHDPARALLQRWAERDEPVSAPRLLLEEVGNARLTGVRRRRWSGSEADSAFALLQSLPVQLRDLPGDVARAYELSRRYDEHPLYDMVYVAMAERLGQRMVTADRRLLERLATLSFVEPLTGATARRATPD